MTSPVQQLAVRGGTPHRTTPFTKWPVHDEAEVQAVTDVVRSGKWWRCAYGTGELEKKTADQVAGRSRVEVFEERFAAAHRAKYGIAVTNGSAALDIALRAVGVQPGDEVITTPYTFVSTSMCIMNNFGVPVYADIDPTTYNIDASQIESLITERTKAIVPVHFSGNLCDMERIMAIARRHGLAVVEDAAHAHGVEYQGKQFAGTFGDLNCFSFQESKNLPTGEGGMILTNSDTLYETAFSMHHLGRLPGEVWYKHFHQAWNARMNEFTAAIGIVQLGRMFEQNARRMENHTYLMERLAQLPGITPCVNLPGITKHSHHLQMLRYNAAEVGGVPRAEFLKALAAEGIPCLAGYTFPNYGNPFMTSDETRSRYRAAGIELPDYRAYAERCPHTERACYHEAVWLEHRLLLGTRQDMDDIVGAFTKVITAFRG
ncbi:MAG: DegT/DnrJ/EryC1/StrS family aminotransferase [Planctomycetaceae bacterium]|nr:DegT/DnrJ/EryC1/StrS family aminotransferase [Planctomycetaceae bacterium]